jgi:Tfp pilus assembly protein PilN
MPTPEIDFLPASHRQRSVHRKANVWRLLIGGGFATALIVSFGSQQLMYRHTVRQLEDLQPAYDQAQALSQRLTAIQGELKKATNQADLFTYLRHPWPRTQLLTAALRQLPDCVTLTEIHIAHAQLAGAAEANLNRLPNKGKDDAEAKKLDSAQRDLRRLCEESAARETTLVLSGTTTDTAALERFLVALGEERLFLKVEMASLEANPEQRAGTWRFLARIAIRPGYGEPGGPQAADVKAVDRRMQTPRQPIRD